MRRRKHGEKRDIVRRFAAISPALVLLAVAACTREAPRTVQVPMLPAADPVFAPLDAGGGDGGDGVKEGGLVELEPSPPADAFACRRDVACRSGAPAPAPSTAPAVKRPPAGSGSAVPSPPSLPSPFERCSLQDDKGRHFSARETRDARLTDVARCCYVSFVDCVRGSSR